MPSQMSSNEFTEREKELMSLAWLCIETEVKVRMPHLFTSTLLVSC